MRELLLILGAACIASLPFVAFNGWGDKAPQHVATNLWDSNLKQSSSAYSMPKAIPVSAERR
ncbi:MAG: hypothetical protein VW600_11105 [Ferrovibrio sp.]